MPWQCNLCEYPKNGKAHCEVCGAAFPEYPVVILPDGSELPAGEGVVLGREMLAGQPGADTVGRSHARLYFHDQGWYITNLHKRRTVELNGEKIQRYQRCPIAGHAVLTLGDCKLQLRIDKIS